jgi:hypothetical protein
MCRLSGSVVYSVAVLVTALTDQLSLKVTECQQREYICQVSWKKA